MSVQGLLTFYEGLWIDLFIGQCTDVSIVGVVWMPWSVGVDYTIVYWYCLIGVFITRLDELTDDHGVSTSVPLGFPGVLLLIMLSTGWELYLTLLCLLWIKWWMGPHGSIDRPFCTFMGVSLILCAYLSYTIKIFSVCHTHIIFAFKASVLTIGYATDSDLSALIIFSVTLPRVSFSFWSTL